MSLYLENPFCNRPFSSSPHSLFQSESKCEILKTDLHNRQRLRTSLWNRDGSELGNFVLPVAGPVWDSLCCSTSQRGSHFTAATLLCICSSEQRFVRDILDCTSQISGEVGADLHADFISWVWTPKNCSQQSFIKRLWHSLFCYVKQFLSLFYCLFSRGGEGGCGEDGEDIFNSPELSRCDKYVVHFVVAFQLIELTIPASNLWNLKPRRVSVCMVLLGILRQYCTRMSRWVSSHHLIARTWSALRSFIHLRAL